MVDKDTENQTKGLRASNTVSTLKPTEVQAQQAQDWPMTPELLGGGNPYVGVDLGQELPQPMPEKIWVGRTATISEGVADALGCTIDDNGTLHAKENLRKLMHGDFEGLPDDSGAFAYTPDEPLFKSKYIGVPDLLIRIEKLEEQVDGLLDRIAKHNIRAQHRI